MKKRTSIYLISLTGMLGLAAVTAAGCHDPSSSRPSGGDEESTASVGMKFVGTDFSQNSVRIAGVRSTVADAKYPCLSAVAAHCVDFGNAAGTVSGDPSLENLCPSTDLSVDGETGTWTFTYTIYAGTGCQPGHELTGAPGTGEDPHNFICFQDNDIASRDFSNEAVGETLLPGNNLNHVLCITTNADKSWDFDVCTVVSGSATTAAVVLDCGCGRNVQNACVCDQGIDTTLPPGCVFDADCNLVCGP